MWGKAYRDPPPIMVVPNVIYTNTKGPVNVKVEAYAGDQSHIDGVVIFDGEQVGATFTSFTYTYRGTMRTALDENGDKIEKWSSLPPDAHVVTNGFPDTQISFNLAEGGD